VEQIRDEIANTVITSDEVSLNITASFGVYVKHDTILSLDEVIKKADEIMYASKYSGKNKVTIGSTDDV
jgi:diguanylate cyclase (GGDEF)-like protein